MAQYIDKSAVVAEIEKMLQEEYPCDNPEQTTGYHCALYELQDFLDTLEVKEVDLDKEINKWQGCEAFPEGVGITPLPKAMEIVERTARHFFELGLKTKEEVVDVEPEKVILKRSTETVEEPLPFGQENNNVFLYGLHGGQPQDEKKELGAITTVRGEDYVCVKDYKEGE